ncbi:MAG: YcgN family cysteine cluster protein [Alphaproteobacteria bacterium]
MENKKLNFWQIKTLPQMSQDEWESLCDGCGRCCLIKLEDEETGDIALTDIACRLLDNQRCKCKKYDTRHEIVPDCVRLTPKNISQLKWMPKSCAYRLLAEGKDLAWWHPLISGNKETVHQAGISIQGKTVSEDDNLQPEDRIVSWFD